MKRRRSMDAESCRLEQIRAGVPWKRWGPYPTDRLWGVRRSDDGDWGDPIASISDQLQQLCFAIVLWDGKVRLRQSRAFALSASTRSSTPTYSYLTYFYSFESAVSNYDDDDRLDVFVEYAKATPEEILIQVTIASHRSTPTLLHVLPTAWFPRP